ncbi:hypothetical protein LXL04_029354 [Taraxacum kok-saghyz]
MEGPNREQLQFVKCISLYIAKIGNKITRSLFYTIASVHHQSVINFKMWPDIIAKEKDGGLDVIETYIFWNYHTYICTKDPLFGYISFLESNSIPPTQTAPMKPGEKLIEIKELDEFAQAAFQGYKSLNFIQSRIFQTTYYTNEKNLTKIRFFVVFLLKQSSCFFQVCAPTGARKTNIAMIFVLHEFGQHFKDGYLHKNEFKIVYVAPMKALAAEVTKAFSHRLAPLNMVVKELTGDMCEFHAEMKLFLAKIVNLMKENLFASQGGPIVLAQVEIEFGNVEGAYGVGEELYVKWAAETAISFNTTVPWVMCAWSDAPDPIVNLQWWYLLSLQLRLSMSLEKVSMECTSDGYSERMGWA